MKHEKTNNVEQVMQALDNLKQEDVSNQQPQEVAEETISDDLNLTEDEINKITVQENVAREVLQLFDINYDELISLEVESPYALAIKANPSVLDIVRQSESPVVDALKIALEFKPYAEFVAKYGNNPEDIKSAIRQELEAELTQSTKPEVKEKAVSDNVVTPFSSLQQAKAKPAKRKLSNNFDELFAR